MMAVINDDKQSKASGGVGGKRMIYVPIRKWRIYHSGKRNGIGHHDVYLADQWLTIAPFW
jgi:hypothetical protein